MPWNSSLLEILRVMLMFIYRYLYLFIYLFTGIYLPVCVFIYLKGGNPKGAFSDDVVTYWNFDEYIEIYIDITIRLSTNQYFQF